MLFALTLVSVFVVDADELLQTRKSWDGKPFHYPEGDAQITSVILHLDEGEMTPWHCHPVPTMGYVLDGSIEVETKDGQKTVMRKGKAVVEVMQTLHRGKGLQGGADIVVFYAGASQVPNTLLQGSEGSLEYCR